MHVRLQGPNPPPAVYLLTILAFTLRLIFRFNSGIADFWANGYRFFFAMAQNIAQGKGIGIEGTPTAFRVPLYPIFLAALTGGQKVFWPIVIAQSLIGAGTAFCAALLARQMFRGPWAAHTATLAAAITAVYPYYVIHDTALEETSLFTLLSLVAVILLRQTALTSRIALGGGTGILLGLDVLTRATIAPFALVAPLWLLWQRRARPAVACALFLVLTVSPWLWRNCQFTGVVEETARFTASTPGGQWESLSADGRVLGESPTRPPGLLLLTVPQPPGAPGTVLATKDAPGLRVASSLPASFAGR